jgi:hypothetical protein
MRSTRILLALWSLGGLNEMGADAGRTDMKMKMLILFAVFFATIGCEGKPPEPSPLPDRESLIPADQTKIQPETDIYPPKSFSAEYQDPVPLPYPINTAGAEDSAFIMPDGNSLYVWFTPDVSKPVDKQILDGVTGIYFFNKVDGEWSPAERVLLQDPGKLAGDGCEFVRNNVMLFCTVREGYTGIHWFQAEYKDGKWQNWENADFIPNFEVGELHVTADGKALYFHSSRPGGKGGYDIWVSKLVDGGWQEPVNVEVVNTEFTDGWPFISPDGNELWFTRGPGAPELWRSCKVGGTWAEPEKMFAPFAGEASMDNEGNVYFTHHFYKDDVMLEADIYIAHPVSP